MYSNTMNKQNITEWVEDGDFEQLRIHFKSPGKFGLAAFALNLLLDKMERR